MLYISGLSRLSVDGKLNVAGYLLTEIDDRVPFGRMDKSDGRGTAANNNLPSLKASNSLIFDK